MPYVRKYTRRVVRPVYKRRSYSASRTRTRAPIKKRSTLMQRARPLRTNFIPRYRR